MAELTLYAWKFFKNFTGTGRHFIVKHELNMLKNTKLEVARARLLSHYQSANLTTSRAQFHYLTTFEVCQYSLSTIDVHYQQMTPPLGPCS